MQCKFSEQPFAELILQEKKKIELRKWNTKFRGKFLIHASKIPDKEAMKKFGFENLPLGCIVGEADLTEVKKYKTPGEHVSDKNLYLADLYWGNYGFVLTGIKRLQPIYCKGKLNFLDFKIT